MYERQREKKKQSKEFIKKGPFCEVQRSFKAKRLTYTDLFKTKSRRERERGIETG